MTIPTLDNLHLDQGAHQTRQDGVCLLEAVAWYAGQDHSDAPACVSPVLRAFGTRLNDRLPPRRRQELKQYIPRLIGTAGDGRDEARGYLAADWVVRTLLPQNLDRAGMHTTAAALRGLDPITDQDTARRALPAARDARRVMWQRYDELGLTAAAVAADAVAAVAAVAAAVAADAADAVAAADVAAGANVAVAAADARDAVYTQAIEFYGVLIDA